MRYLLILSLALISTFVSAETAEELNTRIGAKPTVISCNWSVGRSPQSLNNHGALFYAQLEWYYLDEDGIVQKDSNEVIVKDLGVVAVPAESIVGELAYWAHKRPAIDTTPVETKYITTRTAGGWAAQTGEQQLAAIKTKLNEYWVEAQGNPRDEILNLDIQPVNGNTIKASGEFDTGTGWENRTYYVTLTDPNGSLTAGNANVKFRRLAAQ